MSKETLKANLREIPDFPIPGILFYDVTTLFKNPECLQEILDTLYEMYKDKGITKVVGIESWCAGGTVRCRIRDGTQAGQTSRRSSRGNIRKRVWNRHHSDT